MVFLWRFHIMFLLPYHGCTDSKRRDTSLQPKASQPRFTRSQPPTLASQLSIPWLEAAVLRCITVHNLYIKKWLWYYVYIYILCILYILYTWHISINIYIYIYSIICRCIYGYTWWSFQTENGFKQQEWIWCKVCKTEILPQRCS